MFRHLPHLIATLAIAMLLTYPAVAQMPEGHPQVPSGGAGHPQVPEGHPQLPSGHPQVPGQGAVNNSPFSGSIAVKGAQGTKDAAAPAGDTVRIEFYSDEKIVNTQDGKLDEHGVLILDNVKFLGPVQPLVTITHAGVPYRALGSVMSADHPDQMVRVPVYETTTEVPAPGWTIAMRHVMIERIDKGLLVNEVLALSMPGDRTWIGTPGSGEDHTTLVIPLPANRTETYLGPGLQNEKIKIEGDKIVDHLPLTPGSVQLQIAYIIPVKAGESSLTITAPAPVKQMVIFAPDDGSTITPTGVEAGKTMKMGPQSVRMFSAANIAVAQNVSLAFKAVPAAPAESNATSDAHDHEHDAIEPTRASAAASPGSSDSAKMIAGVGAAVAGVAVAIVLVTKKSSSQKNSAS